MFFPPIEVSAEASSITVSNASRGLDTDFTGATTSCRFSANGYAKPLISVKNFPEYVPITGDILSFFIKDNKPYGHTVGFFGVGAGNITDSCKVPGFWWQSNPGVIFYKVERYGEYLRYCFRVTFTATTPPADILTIGSASDSWPQDFSLCGIQIERSSDVSSYIYASDKETKRTAD